MINFVLKYTGTYGLLAILALAIVTPSYFFFSNQQERPSDVSPKKQVINGEEKVSEKEVFVGQEKVSDKDVFVGEEKVLEKKVVVEKTEENIEKPEKKEKDKQEDKRTN